MSSLLITSLPDVCLLHIFDRLPLRDLATISEVSDHWATLQQTIFTRRGILTLLIGEQPYNLVNIDLRLYIYFEDPSRSNEGKSANENTNDTDPLLESLTTVKSLSLYGGISSHKQMLILQPGNTFPSLNEIRVALSLYGCPDCDYELIGAVSPEKREECYRQMTKPWIQQCPLLKEAYIFNVQIPLSNGLTQTQIYMINNNDDL
ncbi:hypothetical protein TYRP_004386 [Tyrophagus putrescentiae]|nr:hypothetical protein TYRP_004386 [Tyrophagus putrescentiae]